MTKLYIDFETRSAVDIKKVGAWAYARHPSTDIMCMAYAFEDEKEVRLFTLDNIKSGVAMIAVYNGVIKAHNAHFEYAVWNYILHKKYGWPALWDPKYWSCTLARAAMCNLPISLDAAGAALGVAKPKDLTGRSVMLKLSRPAGYDPLFDTPYWTTEEQDPAAFQKLYEYCKRDVEAEMELDRRLPELPEMERRIWELDLVINRRGVLADTATAKKAMDLAASLTEELNIKLDFLTGGLVEKASRVAAIKRYLESQGVTGVASLDKAAVTALLDRPDVSQKVKDVIKIRQQVGKSSTAKYSAILDVADPEDRRMRGLLQYHAAGTGRWGGRLVQPQNFPKGLGYESDKVVGDILNSASAEGFKAAYGDKAMEALSAALRGALVAGEGKTLVVADYSAIEARVLFWLAGEESALAKYRMGVNLYVDMARFLYRNESIKKDSHPREYALSKAAVLGCGFGMGKDKFRATCVAQGIDIGIEMAEQAVQTYRKLYRNVVEMWYAQEAAARLAVRTPGSVHKCGKVVWGMDKRREFLVCKLPSGRHLRYYRPSLKTINTVYGEKEEIHFWCAGLNGSLEENKTYGGSLTENIVQATARDIMANGMLRAEAADYPVILTVHDELVTEVDATDKTKTVDGLIKEMCSLPVWADGCPIAAEGWMGRRYRK
jgi:DNA polymerase bacteriophage-type